MLDFLKEKILQAQFYPGFLGLFVNPFYFARKGLLHHIEALGKEIRGKTLDIGCGQKPYHKLFGSSQYIGLELDSTDNRCRKRADVFYDGKTFPFPDNEFDSVVSNQVFEHVFTPDSFLREANRVLVPRGTLLLTVPFLWDEHEQPHDFARYTSFGIRSLLEQSGFQIVEQRKSVADVRVIFQMINAYIYKKTVTRFPAVNLLLTVVFMAPWNILGELTGFVLPRNDDLYLDNVVLARKAPDA